MIQAKDKGIPSMVNNTTVEVLVIDTNDNPPVFTKPVYTAPVPENAFGGFQVWTLYIVFECLLVTLHGFKSHKFSWVEDRQKK